MPLCKSFVYTYQKLKNNLFVSERNVLGLHGERMGLLFSRQIRHIKLSTRLQV